MRQALEMALEALEEAWYHVGTFQPTEKAIDLYDEARAAIKEALAQPEQEPDKYVMDIECTKCGAKQSGILTVNTTPPQRTWVGLTDEEISSVAYNTNPLDGIRAFARAIEAKIKEINA